MICVETLIEKAYKNNKKVNIDDIYKLNLNEKDFGTLLQKLEELNIKVEENSEQNDYNDTCNEQSYLEDSLKVYLREIGRYKCLSYEEEKELFIRKEQGDEKARKTIIESNLKFVVYMVKRYAKNNLPLLDLIQEGNKGLIKAVDKFDVSKGYKFSTYSSWWIRQYIGRYACDSCGLIRLPVHAAELSKKIKRFEENYFAINQRIPTKQEIADEFNISIKNVEAVKRFRNNMYSLDSEIKEGADVALIDFVADEINIEDEIIEKEEVNSILKLMEKILTPKEYRIICLRVGFSEYKRELTLEEIGKIYGLTRERVRQIESKVIKRIRKILKRNYDNPFNKSYEKIL